jgi:hypothetical protein
MNKRGLPSMTDFAAKDAPRGKLGSEQARRRRKPYHKPRLKKLGTLMRDTKGGSSGTFEPPFGVTSN